MLALTRHVTNVFFTVHHIASPVISKDSFVTEVIQTPLPQSSSTPAVELRQASLQISNDYSCCGQYQVPEGSKLQYYYSLFVVVILFLFMGVM